MKTFLFVGIKAGKQQFVKCRVYEGKLSIHEIAEHIFPDETLVNYEYAHTCSF